MVKLKYGSRIIFNQASILKIWSLQMIKIRLLELALILNVCAFKKRRQFVFGHKENTHRDSAMG